MATHEFAPPADALDVVFAHRNRNYGAYQLRRAYPRYLGRALGIGLLLIGLGIALPQILNAFSTFLSEPSPPEYACILGPPPDIDPELPPPPPPPPPPTPPPPVRATVRFVPPTPTPDELVREEKPPAQDELLKTDAEVSTTTQASKGDGPPTLDDVPQFTQIIETPVKPDDGEYLPGGLQKPPAFPGGEHDLLKYLAENIKYPPLARENNIQGMVVLSFVIGKDGKVSDVGIVKDIGGGCGKEAVRVVQSMPAWIPGEANGYPVKVRFTLPVRFRLQ